MGHLLDGCLGRLGTMVPFCGMALISFNSSMKGRARRRVDTDTGACALNVADSMLRCSEYLEQPRVYCTRSNQGKKPWRDSSAEIAKRFSAFRRAGPPHITHHSGRSYMFEKFLDKQRLRGRTVDIFWSKRLRELVFPHAVGKCRHYHHRRLGRLSMPRLCRTPF